jgi:(R,R)-butanediol dehydrogenase/meso-butanediol dehydrogenase/diacetyl reductase
MKVTIFKEMGKVALKEVPIPQIGPGKVKVKLAYCALCATDVHIVDHSLYGIPPGIDWPLGHEGSGEIIEIGDDVEKYGFKVGDKVIVNAAGYCGKCDDCKRGHTLKCTKGPGGMNGPVGLLAEYAVVEVSQLYKLPADANLKVASLCEPTVSATRGMDLAQIKMGDRIAISGVGGIGSILLQLLIRQGGCKVTAIDPVPAKREMALKLGADFVIDPINENIEEIAKEYTNGLLYDVVFEASGVPAAAPAVLKIIGDFGKAIYFAVFPMNFEQPVNLYELYWKEGRIQTVFTDPFIFPRVIDVLPNLDLDKIIGAELPLDRVEEAFDLFHKSIHPKIVVKCN